MQKPPYGILARLNKLANQYEPVPGYLNEGSLQEMAAGYAEVYRWFLRGRPLTRIIDKLNIAGDFEGARDLAKQLKKAEHFIWEFKSMMYTLEYMGVIELSCMTRLAQLQDVAKKIANPKAEKAA